MRLPAPVEPFAGFFFVLREFLGLSFAIWSCRNDVTTCDGFSVKEPPKRLVVSFWLPLRKK